MHAKSTWHATQQPGSIHAAICKGTAQVKNLGKKAQQTTPHGSPTKPQPAQRTGPLEALKVSVSAALSQPVYIVKMTSRFFLLLPLVTCTEVCMQSRWSFQHG